VLPLALYGYCDVLSWLKYTVTTRYSFVTFKVVHCCIYNILSYIIKFVTCSVMYTWYGTLDRSYSCCSSYCDLFGDILTTIVVVIVPAWSWTLSTGARDLHNNHSTMGASPMIESWSNHHHHYFMSIYYVSFDKTNTSFHASMAGTFFKIYTGIKIFYILIH